MSTVFIFYMVFAVATGFTALYEIMIPVMQERQLDDPKLQNVGLLYFVFFCCAVLSAPVIFLSCIVPPWGERFRNTLARNIFEIPA